jgi:hypothetical protein
VAKTVIHSFPNDAFQLLAQTAKTQAVAGASAGVTLGLIRGVIYVRRRPLRDGYDVAAEGLTQVSIGAILGIFGAMAASVTGVWVAAVAGRGVLSVAIPAVASAMVSGSAHEPVDRLVRPWSEGVINSLKVAMGRMPVTEARPQPPQA